MTAPILTTAYKSFHIKENIWVWRKMLSQYMVALSTKDDAALTDPKYLTYDKLSPTQCDYAVGGRIMRHPTKTKTKPAGATWSLSYWRVGEPLNTQIVSDSLLQIESKLLETGPTVCVSMALTSAGLGLGRCGQEVSVTVTRTEDGAFDLYLATKLAPTNRDVSDQLNAMAAFLMGEIRLAAPIGTGPLMVRIAPDIAKPKRDTVPWDATGFVDAAGLGIGTNVESLVNLSLRNQPSRAYND